MTVSAPIPLWRNRSFQVFGAVSSLIGSWIAYDRWKDGRIQGVFEEIAKEHGSRVGEVKRITILLPRIKHKETDGEGEKGRDEMEAEFKVQCKKFVIPLLTLAGIDYHFFAHSDMAEVYRRWVKYFTTGEAMEPLEGFVQPQSDAFLRQGVVCTSDAMFDQIVPLGVPPYKVYRVSASPPGGMLKRCARFFNHSGERQRIGQRVLELIKVLDQ